MHVLRPSRPRQEKLNDAYITRVKRVSTQNPPATKSVRHRTIVVARRSRSLTEDPPRSSSRRNEVKLEPSVDAFPDASLGDAQRTRALRRIRTRASVTITALEEILTITRVRIQAHQL